jgi:hypothetical protein
VKRSPVTRLRQLTPGQTQRLEVLRRISRLLDSALPVPGTTFRFGLDPILGLIPGLGDLVSPLFTIGIIWQARDLGVPRVVQARMIFNVIIDTALGLIPLAGDLFDFAWKSNNMNLALLERHAVEEHEASRSDWGFVILCTAALIAIAAVPLLLIGWIFSVLGGLFN